MRSGKKALLLAINSKYIHSNPAVYSLAAYYERRAAESRGGKAPWMLSVKEYTINDVVGNILQGIVREKPDLLAVSVYIWNVETVKRLLPDLRVLLPEAIIVLGGPEISFGTEHCGIDKSLFDYVVEGEGELCFAELLDKLSAPSYVPAGELPGVLRADRLLSMEELPFIYDGRYSFGGGIEAFKNRIVYYETSRGCPYSCAYCLSGGDCAPVRFLPEETVFKHIDFFCRSKVPLVKFVDRTFNCNPARAKAIIRKISELDTEECMSCFHFEVGADLFDDEFLELLSRVPKGRVQIEAGIQSLNGQTLSASVRKTDNRRLFKNIEAIVGCGNINVHTDLIAGLPFEGIESFKESFNKTYSLKAHQLQLGFLKRLQGAPLCEKETEYGLVFSKTAPYEVLKTKWLGFDEIIRLKRVEASLERYYNSGFYSMSLAVLEKCFAAPYELYEAIADFSKTRGHGDIYAATSKRAAFDMLYEFGIASNVEKICGAEKTGSFAELLLLDYFSSDKSELPPESLRFTWRHSRTLRSSEAEIFKANGTEDFKGFGIRCIGEKMYIFDYNKKDAVTGRYYYREAVNGR